MQEIIAVNNYMLIRGNVSSKKDVHVGPGHGLSDVKHGFSTTLIQKLANEDCAEFTECSATLFAKNFALVGSYDTRDIATMSARVLPASKVFIEYKARISSRLDQKDLKLNSSDLGLVQSLKPRL